MLFDSRRSLAFAIASGILNSREQRRRNKGISFRDFLRASDFFLPALFGIPVWFFFENGLLLDIVYLQTSLVLSGVLWSTLFWIKRHPLKLLVYSVSFIIGVFYLFYSLARGSSGSLRVGGIDILQGSGLTAGGISLTLILVAVLCGGCLVAAVATRFLRG